MLVISGIKHYTVTLLTSPNAKSYIFRIPTVFQEMAQHEDGRAKYHQLHREYRVAKKLCCMRYAKLGEEELCTELKKLKQSYLDDNSIDVYDEMLWV